FHVTGVQTCALPIATRRQPLVADRPRRRTTSLSHPTAQLLIIPTRQFPGGYLTRDTVLTPLIPQRDDALHNVLVLPSRDERAPHLFTPHTRVIPPSSHRPSARLHRSRRARQHSTAVTVSGVDKRIWVLKQFPHALIAGRILLPARPRGRRIQIGALPRDPHPDLLDLRGQDVPGLELLDSSVGADEPTAFAAQV